MFLVVFSLQKNGDSLTAQERRPDEAVVALHRVATERFRSNAEKLMT